MKKPVDHILNASRITGSSTRGAGELWQGGLPVEGPYLASKGVDVLVLCAEEFQIPRSQFPGVKVVYAPNDDSGRPPTECEVLAARLAGLSVAKYLSQGKRVLVTCAAGRNRSGLVSGFALLALGAPVDKVIARIRERRENALMNPHFVRLLHTAGQRSQTDSIP